MVRQQTRAFAFVTLAICFPICGLAQSPNQGQQDSRIAGPARIQVDKNLSNSKTGNPYWRTAAVVIPSKQQSTSQDLIRRQQDDSAIVRAAEESAMDDLMADEERTFQQETLGDWPRQSISEIPINPRDMSSQVPEDRSAPLIDRFARNWNEFESTEKLYQWQAPNIYYRPLYFEDVSLERYGHSHDDYWQTAFSAAHFFSSAFLLPLHMRHDPISSCDYPLGYCRPGNCTNRIWQRQFWGLR